MREISSYQSYCPPPAPERGSYRVSPLPRSKTTMQSGLVLTPLALTPLPFTPLAFTPSTGSRRRGGRKCTSHGTRDLTSTEERLQVSDRMNLFPGFCVPRSQNRDLGHSDLVQNQAARRQVSRGKSLTLTGKTGLDHGRLMRPDRADHILSRILGRVRVRDRAAPEGQPTGPAQPHPQPEAVVHPDQP